MFLIANRMSESDEILHKMPGIHHPVAAYYMDIEWENGFENFPLVRFSTPADNNCLFHAILNAFFPPYHSEIINGKTATRTDMVLKLRKELSEKLSSNMKGNSYYSYLNGGNTAAFADAGIPEFSLSYMKHQLENPIPIGYGYMEFLGLIFDKDIYILEGIRHDIYITDELPLTIKGNRNSIVLYYHNGHYELVGLKKSDGSFSTHFSPNHSFIKFLNKRVQTIVSKMSK